MRGKNALLEKDDDEGIGLLILRILLMIRFMCGGCLMRMKRKESRSLQASTTILMSEISHQSGAENRRERKIYRGTKYFFSIGFSRDNGGS